MNEEV